MAASQCAVAATAAAVPRRRAPRFAAKALLACGAGLALLFARSTGFVGGSISGSQREVSVSMGDIITYKAGRKRMRKWWHTSADMVEDPESQLISKRRLMYLQPEEGDKPWSAGGALGKELTVEFEDTQTGILRWKAGKGNVGAMVMQVGKPLFVGDIFARAANAGVTPGMVVKAVNGKDVTQEKFDTIMTLASDQSLSRRGRKPDVKCPALTITFAELNA